MEISLATIKYLWELHKHADSLKHPGFHNLSNELSQPFGLWLKDKGMEILERSFQIPIACYGYGLLTEIPAAYALKYMDVNNFLTNLYIMGIELIGDPPQWPLRIKNGFQALMRCLENSLTKVIKNVEIKGVRRDKEKIEVNFRDKTTNKSTSMMFDKLIIAILPAIDSLESIRLDITGRERDLFSRVVKNNFFSTLCRVDDDFDYKVFGVLMKNGEYAIPDDSCPFLLGKLWKDSKIVNFYSYSQSPTTTISDIQQKLKEFLHRIGKTKFEIILTRQWNYFAHVKNDLTNFYNDFENLQKSNAKNTLYTGAIANFELVENTIAYSNYLVGHYF